MIPILMEHHMDITTSRVYNTTKTGPELSRTAFPMGGIGSGTICLEGTGGLSHVSLRHAPDIFSSPFIFGALKILGKEMTARVRRPAKPRWQPLPAGLPSAGDNEADHNAPQLVVCAPERPAPG